MKITLANPPWEKDGPYYAVRAGSRWPHFEREGTDYQPFPFFLAIAAALLQREGHEVQLIDALAERLTPSQFIARVLAFSPQVIFFEIATPSLENDVQIANQLAESINNNNGHPHLIFGGLHQPVEGIATLFEHCKPLSVFIHGEYEFPLAHIAKAIESGFDDTRLAAVAGIHYRTSKGSVDYTGQFLSVEDVDTLPDAAYHLLPLDAYYDACGGLPKPSVQVWASRGCPYNCVFCVWPQLMYGNRKYRTRSPQRVAAELSRLIAQYGFKSAYFDDDTFNIGKKRMLALAAALKQAGVSVPWGAMCRADTMDRETLQALVEAGLCAVKYGVESGDQRLLDACGKGLDLDSVRRTVEMTRAMGISYHLSFAFGLPGENWETVKKTVNLAIELDPTTVQFSLITPFPGSDYYHSLKNRGFLTSEDHSKYDGYSSAVIRTEELSSRDLEKALAYAEARWRRHLLWRIIRQEGFSIVSRAVTHPEQIWNLAKSYFVSI